MVLRVGEVDYSKKIVKPSLSLCKPNREIIDVLDTAYDIQMDELLGALNELNFKLPIYIDKHHKKVRNDSVDIIKGRYIVLLELGNYKEYFLINQIDRVSGNDEYLEVTCLSLTYELNDKIIRGYEVVSYNCSAILKDLLRESIWSVKYVDSEFDLTYRSFEVSSSTALEAVIELAKTFNALLLYDTINRTISFYNPSNVGEDKGFSISYGKYLESVNQEDNSEEIITRLRMFGKEEISIQDVVPTGQQYIEDFNYFVYPYEETYNEINKSYTSTEMIDSWKKIGFASNFTPIVDGLRIDSSTGSNRIIGDIDNLNNFRVSFDVKNHSNNVGAKYSIIFGYIDSSNYYQLVHERTSEDIDENSLRLYKVSGGNLILLSDKSTVMRWSPNIDYKIILEVFNGIISVKIDNVIALDYTDEGYSSGGFGFGSESNSTSFTNISSTIINHNIINHSEFMTDELCYYIKRYDELLNGSKGEFNTLVGYRTSFYEQLGILDDELQDLTTEYKKLLDERDIFNTRIARNQDSIDKADNVEQPTDFLEGSKSSLVSQRDAKLVEISLKEEELNAKNSEIAVVQVQFDSLMHEIDSYRVKISLENNFPSKVLNERKQFVIEKEWQDNNIITSEALLEEGLKVFDEYRKQKITVNIDVVNFLEMIEEQINWDKLVIADNFYIDHERLGFVYQAKITGINYDFEGSKISLTISNVKDVYSNKNKFLEMLYKSNQVSSSVSMKEWEWDLALENRGSINELINNIWDANRQAIIGAKDQVIEISDRGLIIRDENDPLRYLVAINGMIALTNDGGATFKHAITTDGIVGERIYGKVIMGVNLAIEDESGILTIQGSRGKIFNRDGVLRMHFGLVEENGLCGESFGLISENEITQVKVTDCEGFVINRKNPNEADYPDGWEKVFWTTPEGTIYAHDLVVSDIKVVQNKEWTKLIMDSELGFFDLGFFSKIVKDGKLTTDEKLQLITELARISSSYMTLLKQVEKYNYVKRDDDIDFDGAFNTNPSVKDFYRVGSSEQKLSTTALDNAYLELISFMSQHIKVTSTPPHKPLVMDRRDAMTETTSDLGDNREKLVILFKNYYDEYDKLSDDIEDVIVYQGLSMGENYNNVYIGEHGLVVVRNDGIYRAVLNATNGLSLDKWENGVWQPKLFATLGHPMWEDGTLYAKGLVTENLRIVDANMNDKIKFDWYDGITIFGDSNTIYLNANDSIKITDLSGDSKFWVDMNGFLYAKDITTHNLKIVDGELGERITFDQYNGISIYGDNADIFLNANDAMRIKTKDGEDRFWVDTDGFLFAKKLYIMGDDDEMIEDIDGSYISDLTVNRLKTLGKKETRQDIIHIEGNYIKFKTWFKDREYTKLNLEFEGTGEDSYPVMTFGVGNGRDYGTGANQAKMFKDDDKWMFEYDRLESWGSKSKLVFNSTDTDNHGQAIYMRSKGGIRLESENRVVMRAVGAENPDGSSQPPTKEAYVRVGVGGVGEKNVALKFGEATLILDDDKILIRWDDSNYIEVSSSGVTVKGSKINLN